MITECNTQEEYKKKISELRKERDIQHGLRAQHLSLCPDEAATRKKAHIQLRTEIRPQSTLQQREDQRLLAPRLAHLSSHSGIPEGQDTSDAHIPVTVFFNPPECLEAAAESVKVAGKPELTTTMQHLHRSPEGPHHL